MDGDGGGTQSVCVQDYLGEPTLTYATAFALEALGGRDRRGSLSDESRRKFRFPVSSAELQRRDQRARIDALLVVMFAGPLVIASMILSLLWAVVSLPWRISKALYGSVKRTSTRPD